MIISKSRFVSGMQCPKKLFFDVKKRKLKPPVSKNQELLFSKGHDIGFLARNLFKGGLDASPEHYYDFSRSIQQTHSWINKRVTTIYEAAFEHDGVLAALDILHLNNNSLWAIEVKSSAGLKAYHLTDAALQYWVMDKSGHRPDRFFILHLNSNYVRSGKLDWQEIFTLKDITEEVLLRQQHIAAETDRLKKVLSGTEEPEVKTGRHCLQPFSCDYQFHCRKNLPEDSIYKLPISDEFICQLLEKGIETMDQLPAAEAVFPFDSNCMEAIRNNRNHTHLIGIRNFLQSLKAPVHLLDIQNLITAIPPVNQARPYQPLPFQFCLMSEADEWTCYQSDPADFCALDEHGNLSTKDPAKKLTEALERLMPANGDFLVMDYEGTVKTLNTLAKSYPEKMGFLMTLKERIKDFRIPFNEGHFYFPGMKHHPSAESILQCIKTDYRPESPVIQSSAQASACFESMISGNLHVSALSELEKFSRKNLNEIQMIIDYLDKLS